jgi:hypothetical protein
LVGLSVVVLFCIFRGLVLLYDIHQRMGQLLPKKDVAEEAYEQYLKDNE